MVGSPIANRQDTQLEGLIGFFVNTLAMRVRVRPSLSLGELLAQVRRTALEAYRHQDVPFERVVEAVAPERSTNIPPVCQVVLSLEDAPGTALALSDVRVDPMPAGQVQVRFDMEVHVQKVEDALMVKWVYDRALFDRWRIEQMARHYRLILMSMATDVTGRCGDVELLDEAERRQVLVEWNATAASLPAASLPALFEAQVAAVPDGLAAVAGEAQVTYAGLNRRANRVAHLLIRRGRGAGGRGRGGAATVSGPGWWRCWGC